MKHRIRVLFSVTCLIVCALLTTSCAKIEDPVVTITGVDFHGLSNEGLEFRLLADVDNPNGFGADISGLDYQVFLDDTRVASGRQSDVVHVEANSTSEVAIPFTLIWEGADKGLSKMLDGGKHDWRLKGSVKLSKGALSRTFSFSEGGNFNAPRASEIDLDFDL
ncbi:MAG: LEA type 2 family protein [Candidatus Eisenbacteria bacterium]|nr:LEA type 2 family protein [Candidatus Eisenbacteria bacterium]